LRQETPQPPPEIRYQLLQVCEEIGKLLLANVLVIALSYFIIEANDTNFVDHKRQTILEAVGDRAWIRSREC